MRRSDHASWRFVTRRASHIAALAAALLVGLAVTMASSAMAISSQVVTAGAAAPAIPAETVYSYTGGEQSYTVPSNVLLVGLDVAGASGGGGNVGAFLGGYLPVQGGQTLYAEVGRQGSFGGGATFGGGGAAGAWTCPGSCSANAPAGSGGGASDVRTCSELASNCAGGVTSDASRVIVAGGGGGAGGVGESPGFLCTQIPQSGRAFNQQNPLPTGNATQGPLPVVTAAGIVIPGEPADFDYGGPIADVTSSTGGSSTPGSGGSLSGCATTTEVFGPTTAGTDGIGSQGAPGAAVAGTAYGTPEGPSGYLPGAGGGGGGGYTGGGSGAAGYICLGAIPPGPCNDPSSGMSGGGGASFESNQVQAPYIEDGIPGPAGSVTVAPIVEVDAPTDGAIYTPDEVVDASWACGGGGTPFQGTSCTGTVASGSPIDTSPGTHTFTVTAVTAPFRVSVPVSVTYTVTAPQPAATTLTAAPQVVIFPPPVGVGLGRVSATLTSGGEPVAGQTIAFSAGPHSLCSASTGSDGSATCSLSLVRELEVLAAGGYTATYAGNADYAGSTAATPAIEFGPHAPALTAAAAHHAGIGVRGRLTSRGRVYATVSGQARGGNGPLRLRSLGHLHAGRYTLILTLVTGHSRATIRRTLTLG